MIRTTRPGAGNKYYITKSAGGYSTCIVGKPTDSLCNVLSNCVGYACGAANEELALGYEKYHLNCNAENFIERAIASGLSVYKTPQVGDIICWEGVGSLAGHVGIVIEVINSNCIRVAQSGWGSTNPFYITTNYNNNGRWGLSSNYPCRGFIRILSIKPTPVIDPFPGVSDEELARRVWTGEFGNGADRKRALGSRYNSVQALVNKGVGKPSTPTPAPQPAPQPTGLKVGDKVKIIGTGNGSSYGDSNTAGGIGWTREILRIWSGRPFPYQVGNSTGTTGFYKESSLQKL